MAEKLTIEINGKDNASGALRGVGSALGRIRDVAGGILVAKLFEGLASGLRSVASAAGQLVQEAADEEAGINRLGAAVSATGADWDEASASIERYLDAELDRIALDDGEGRDALTRLTTATNDYTRALELMPLVADLAAAKDMDMAAAAEVVGKVAAGNTGILSRYGIVLEDGATATEALAHMQQRFAGQAEAYADSTAGAQDKVRIALGNLREAIGGALLPTLRALAERVLELVQSEQFQAWVDTLVAGIGRIGETVLAVVDNLLAGDIEGAMAALFGPEIAGQVMAIADAIGRFVTETLVPFVTEHAEALKAALLAIGAVLAAAAIASGIASIGAAIAALANPITLIVAGVALLAAAWTEDWGGIRTTLTQFWETTGRPIFEQVKSWLAQHIPAAIETVRNFWLNTLQPALQTVWDFIANTLIPIFVEIATTTFAIVQAAIQSLTAYWENVLLPAITAVWSFIQDYLIPLFTAVGEVMRALGQVTITALAGFWQNVLLPAITAVYSFLADKLTPVFETVKGWLDKTKEAGSQLGAQLRGPLVDALEKVRAFVEDKAGPVLRWFKRDVVDALAGGFNGIRDAIRWVIGKLEEFKTKLENLSLPGWLTPGSPTPFENGLVGIAKAMDGLNRLQLPGLALGLDALPAPAPVLAEGGIGSSGGSAGVALNLTINAQGTGLNEAALAELVRSTVLEMRTDIARMTADVVRRYR